MQLIAKILLYSSYLSVLIPIYYMNRNKIDRLPKINRGLAMLLWGAAFADLLGYILIKSGKSNIVIDNIYFMVLFLVLSYIYTLLLKHSRVIYIGIGVYILFSVINILFIEPFTVLQSWPMVLQSIVLMSYAILSLIELNANPPEDEQLISFILWINMAVLFYFGMNLYLFITIDYIFKNESDEIAMLSWSFHNLCNIIKNILFAVAISCLGIRGSKTIGLPQREF